MFIDDQQPSTASISVFLITKYTIDSVLSVYHITILLNVTMYITAVLITTHVVADEVNYVATSLSTLLLHCVCRITKHL